MCKTYVRFHVEFSIVGFCILLEVSSVLNDWYHFSYDVSSFYSHFSSYRDLYPMLMKMVPPLSQLTSGFQANKSTFELRIQQAAAMVTLLTKVTQTAGCTAQLQAQLIRYSCLLILACLIEIFTQ